MVRQQAETILGTRQEGWLGTERKKKKLAMVQSIFQIREELKEGTNVNAFLHITGAFNINISSVSHFPHLLHFTDKRILYRTTYLLHLYI
jgi:hypothetical protein